MLLFISGVTASAHRQFGHGRFSQFEIQTIQPKIYRQFSLRQFCQIKIQKIQPETTQSVLHNLRFDRKKSEVESFIGLRSPVGALRARHRFAAITGSKFRIEFYPLLARSHHVGATAAVTIVG